MGKPLAPLAEAFVLGKRISGCTAATLRVYEFWLTRLVSDVPDATGLTPAVVVRFFETLRDRGLSPATVHQAYRTVKAFARWLRSAGTIRVDPMSGLRLRTPRRLPDVATEDEVRTLLRHCGATFEGTRNRAMVLVMADAGLRAAELRRLLVSIGTLRTGAFSCGAGRARPTG